MSVISDLANRVKSEIERFGVADGIQYWARQAAVRARNDVVGENVYDYDWDALIVLDACRVDELKRQSAAFDFLSDVDQLPSVATYSPSWMEKTFGNAPAEELEHTAYVTANPFSKEITEVDKIGYVDHVWEYATDQSVNVVPPRPVTDRAIETARSQSFDRVVVHYMQPHAPFIRQSNNDVETILDGNQHKNDYGDELGVWPAIYDGYLDLDDVIKAYRETLEFVLNDVELLLQNIDAPTTVISADHGQLFGEKGLYGHPPNMPISAVQYVPWIKTTASDTKDHQPQSYTRTKDRINRNERLRALGYK